jgi:hypothetical protein
MVAPLIPKFAHEFATSSSRVGLAVPAYLTPYGVATRSCCSRASVSEVSSSRRRSRWGSQPCW